MFVFVFVCVCDRTPFSLALVPRNFWSLCVTPRKGAEGNNRMEKGDKLGPNPKVGLGEMVSVKLQEQQPESVQKEHKTQR